MLVVHLALGVLAALTAAAVAAESGLPWWAVALLAILAGNLGVLLSGILTALDLRPPARTTPDQPAPSEVAEG